MAGLAEIISDPNYVSANPETKAAIFEKHAPNDPNFANANAETQAAIREKFGVTTGGAATGNPSIQAQGRKGMGLGFNADPVVAIGGAGAIGGALGAFSKELLGGAGNVIGGFPHPAAQTTGRFLKGASQLIGAGGRAAPAAAGAISGVASETAGQTAEAFGAGPALAEASRFVAGAVGPETANFAKWALKKVISAPAMSIWHKVWKSGAQEVLSKLDAAPETLTQQERQYLDSLIAEIRGPAGKTNQPLEEVGSIMGQRGRELMDAGDQALIAAQQRAAGVTPGASREAADIGGELQSSINTRYKGAIDARKTEYAANEDRVNKVVSFKEGQGRYVNQLPEYQALVSELSAKLDSKVTQIPASQQAGYRKMVDDLRNANPDARYPDLQGSTQSMPDGTSSMSFEALDRIRRKLGEAFRGKPAEGYEAIGSAEAKVLYGRVSELQKKFAGPGQAKLLDDYAERTEGLNIFSSKFGKKSTALDQYREDTFATDPSTLPAAYFKTRASVQALKELTGNQAQVNNAALEFANKQLAGKDADGVRKWLSANTEWLAETGPTRTLIDRYATRLEAVEKQVNIAKDFAKQISGKNDALVGKGIPANQATALILSKDADLWNTVIPAIQNSPQAKANMVSAVRQVVANRATSKETADLFELSIRPFLERSSIASRAEMDSIAQSLARIQEMKVPEAEKLGIMKRMILQGAGGWAASAAGRGMSAGYNYATGVPQ